MSDRISLDLIALTPFDPRRCFIFWINSSETRLSMPINHFALSFSREKCFSRSKENRSFSGTFVNGKKKKKKKEGWLNTVGSARAIPPVCPGNPGISNERERVWWREIRRKTRSHCCLLTSTNRRGFCSRTMRYMRNISVAGWIRKMGNRCSDSSCVAEKNTTLCWADELNISRVMIIENDECGWAVTFRGSGCIYIYIHVWWIYASRIYRGIGFSFLRSGEKLLDGVKIGSVDS